jgi:hypothetical protein
MPQVQKWVQECVSAKLCMAEIHGATHSPYGRGPALLQRTNSISLSRHSFVKKDSSGL